jgi:hypothetical protein
MTDRFGHKQAVPSSLAQMRRAPGSCLLFRISPVHVAPVPQYAM